MYINEFQEFVVDSLEAIIVMCKEKNKSKDIFLSSGSNHALKRGFINHYPSMYLFNNKYVNLYQKDKINLNEPLLQSENAYLLLKAKEEKKELSKNEKSNLLYWEHFIPNDIIWRKLVLVFDNFMADKIIRSDLNMHIKKCFDGQKLVLLTQAESHLLDNIGGRKCELIDNLTDDNVVVSRLKILIDECNVKAFYLNDIRIPASDVIKDGKLSSTIEKYFNDDHFGA